MLNEERIILMTKLASYESGEGKKNAAIGGYFRSDYIGMQVVKPLSMRRLHFLFCLGYIFFMILKFLWQRFIRWICLNLQRAS